MSGGAAPQLCGGLRRSVERDRRLLAASSDLNLDLVLLDAALPDREADRHAQELGVGELLPRARVAVVVDRVEAERLELLVEAVGDVSGLFAGLAERDEVDVEGGYRLRPADAGLVAELLDGGGEDARRADAVGAHPDVLLLALLVEIGGVQRLAVAGAELEDVAYFDGGLDADGGAGGVGVTRLHRSHIAVLSVEISAWLDPQQMSIDFIRTRDKTAQPAQRLVDQNGRLRVDRTDEARVRAEVALDLLVVRELERRMQVVAELDLVEAVVAPQQHEERAPALDDHGHGLDQRAARDAKHARDLLDRGCVRRVDKFRLLPGVRQVVHRLRGGARDLDVRRVARIAHGHVVLARLARRHVLVGAEAAHHPDVRLDLVEVEPRAREDAVVGAGLELVLGVEAVAVAIEGVGVLHDELARAKEAGARPRLVPLLGLDVVEHLGEVAVGADLARHVEGDDLFLGHAEHVGAALAVLDLEELVDVVAAGLLPQLRRMHDRHEHLPRPDRVHLLADDLLDLAVDTPPCGQERPQTGADLPDEARPHEQLVADRLGVGGGLLDGRQEVLAETGHRRRLILFAGRRVARYAARLSGRAGTSPTSRPCGRSCRRRAPAACASRASASSCSPSARTTRSS